MKIGFSMNVDREAKTVETFAVCPQCRQEVQMSTGPTTVVFKCETHGDLGAMSVAEFQHAFNQAQASVAAQEGFGKPVRTEQHFIPSDPDKMN